MPIPTLPARPPSRVGTVVLVLILASLIILYHFASGATHSELGSHPDEAAHFVTGLMVRDYLASGFHQSPLSYADQYYHHYPKIGLGIWPPFFYLVQALWTLLFPVGLNTLLWLMATLDLALALTTAWWLRRQFGWIEAVAGAVLLISLPLIQQYSNMIMAEMLSALLMFGATGFFALYMEAPGKDPAWRSAIGFGLCAGLAIMTKGTGLALAFVPLLAILFTRRWSLLRRPSLWAAAAIVAVIAGPWTWRFRNQGRGGWEQPSPSLAFTQRAILFYGREMAVALGALLALLALAGAASLFLPKSTKTPIAVCSLALVLGVWLFQCLAPVGLEARHLTPAMPALILLAMTALHTFIPSSFRCTAMAILLSLFFLLPSLVHLSAPTPGYGSIGNIIPLSPFRIPRKQWSGFQTLVNPVLAAGPSKPILVASDARGEGMFIADVASRDPHRPSYIIERASKILASSTWSGSGYTSLYQTPAQVRDALSKAGIGLIVTDTSLNPLPPHDKLLVDSLAPAGSPSITSSAIRDGKVSQDSIKLITFPN